MSAILIIGEPVSRVMWFRRTRHHAQTRQTNAPIYGLGERLSAEQEAEAAARL
jgi:hypothetical protein